MKVKLELTEKQARELLDCAREGYNEGKYYRGSTERGHERKFKIAFDKLKAAIDKVRGMNSND